MGMKFKKTEKLFNTEDKFIKKLEAILKFDFGNFDDLVSFYKNNIEKDNFKIINDAHVEIRNYFYKTDKFNIYLNERIKKHLLPLNNNYNKIGKQFEEKYNIDFDETTNIDSLDTENKKIYELYMCIMDFAHDIKLTALESLYNDAVLMMNKDINLQNDKTPSTKHNDDNKIDTKLYFALCSKLNIFGTDDDKVNHEQRAIFVKNQITENPKFKKLQIKEAKLTTYERYSKFFMNNLKKSKDYFDKNEDKINDLIDSINSDSEND